MNDLPSQLREAAEIIEKGLPWEWQWTDVLDAGKWSKGHTETSLLRFLHPDENKVVRKKPWTLPAPPPGRAWHRTDWQEDMLPHVTDGGLPWRPLLNNETYREGDEYRHQQGSAWLQMLTDSGLVGSCYFARTRRPVDPPPPVMVPLEAADVPPGSAFRRARDKAMAWQIACSADDYGVRLMNEYNQCNSWAELRNYYQILRPGRDPVTGWEPCQKEGGPHA